MNRESTAYAEQILLQRLGCDPESAAAEFVRDALRSLADIAADLEKHPLGYVQQCDHTKCKTTRIRSLRDGQPTWVHVYPLHAKQSPACPTPERCTGYTDTQHRWAHLKRGQGVY